MKWEPDLRVCPLQFDLQEAHIYCDPELVLEEGCCEILPGGVSGPAPAERGRFGAFPRGVVCWRWAARTRVHYLRISGWVGGVCLLY